MNIAGVNAQSVVIVVGLVALFTYQFGGIKAPFNLQPGFIGLILNFVTVLVVSTFTKPVDAKRLDRQAERDHDAALEAYNAELTRRAEEMRRAEERWESTHGR